MGCDQALPTKLVGSMSPQITRLGRQRAKGWALAAREGLEQGRTYKIGVGTGSVPEMKSLRLKVGIGSQIVNDDAKFPHLVDVAAHPVHRMASVSRRRRPIHTRR